MFCCFCIWVWGPVKIISLILRRVNRKVGQKQEIPEKKHLTTRKQNLARDPREARTHSGEVTSNLER